MNIYDFIDYKKFINSWISSRPKRGRGVMQQISKKINVHPTLVSQVLKGTKNFTLEQAGKLTKFLYLKENEVNYFLLLVQFARAGDMELKMTFKRQIVSAQRIASEISSRLISQTKLTEKDKAIFYSNWHYSAIRLLTSIEKYQTKDSLMKGLNLPESKVSEVLDFLVSRKLCYFDGEKFELGPQSTHLESQSPFVSNHHKNWRLRACDRFHNMNHDMELAFSSPLTISRKDAVKIRGMIIGIIEEVSAIVKDSSAEEMMLINIDGLKLLD